MIPMAAISESFKKYATFSGRASRLEFWWFIAFLCFGLVVCEVIDTSLASEIKIVGGIFSLVTTIPLGAVHCRRLHDIGKSGWWLILLIMLPIVGWMLYYVWLCRRGSEQENRFGAVPTIKEKNRGQFLLPFIAQFILFGIYIGLITRQAIDVIEQKQEFTQQLVDHCKENVPERLAMYRDALCGCVVEQSFVVAQEAPGALKGDVARVKLDPIIEHCASQVIKGNTDAAPVSPTTSNSPTHNMQNTPQSMGSTPEPVPAIPSQSAIDKTNSVETMKDAPLTADERYMIQNRFIQNCTTQFAHMVSVPQRIRNLCGCLSTDLLKNSTNTELRHFQSSGAIPSHVHASVQSCADKLR